MRNQLYALLILLAGLILSCSSPQKKALENVETMESTLYSDTLTMIDQVKADELIVAYIDYADKYPEDPNAPVFLFRAGDIMMNLMNPPQAVEIFARIIEDYPDYEKVPEAMFLQAFVYENHIGDMENARETYTKFLEKYPENDFADDAEICIKNLGKTPEELIMEFEENQRIKDSLEALAN